MLSDGLRAVKRTELPWCAHDAHPQSNNDAVGFVSHADVASLFFTPVLIGAKIFRARGSKRAQRPAGDAAAVGGASTGTRVAVPRLL